MLSLDHLAAIKKILSLRLPYTPRHLHQPPLRNH
jgi:hypothetical protein